MTPEELMQNAKTVLENEGELSSADNLSTDQVLKEFILPGLKNSKDTLSSIYTFKSRNREGFFGRFKTFLQSKIIYTVINVIERPSMKQQKYNVLLYKAIENLVKENEELKAELSSLKSKK